MFRKIHVVFAVLLFASLPLLAVAADSRTGATHLTAAEIVDKNVTARGGLAAWRAAQALTMKGMMEAGGNNRPNIPVPGVKTSSHMVPPRPAEQVQLPFSMDLKRPRKMRVELKFNGQTAVQVYDGAKGWKVRPFLNRSDAEPFTEEELKLASAESDLDGPLIDYASKGSKVDLEGIEKVDGRNAYKLKVTDKHGNARHVWIDAENFLDTKIEGNPRRLDGKYHPVSVYFHDYRPVNGLMMPYLVETVVENAKQTEKMQIESIVVNPKLDDSRFTMPR